MTLSSSHEGPSVGGGISAGFTPLLWLALAIAVGLRVTGLDWAPLPSSDEGGWPLSVRQWAEDGIVTFDFHTAPAYHLILGAVYELAPRSIRTARILSALLSLALLPLFWWIARRLAGGPKVAAWATVIWASAYPAIDIARRALIEPIQMAWLLGLVAALTLSGRTAALLATLSTAGLLLTKANAVVLLPVFALALWWDRAPVLRERRRQKVAGMVLGTAVAALAFLLLYRYDAATFLRGWGATMLKPSEVAESPILRVGRFVLDPRLVLDGVKFLAAETPFLFAFGVVAAIQSLRDRRLSLLAGGWIIVLLPFLLLQVIQSPQYFSVLYPAMSLCAAGLLVEAARREPAVRGWASLAVAVIVIEGLGRSAGALASTTRPDRPAVEYLRTNVADSERVVGAPYMLMQLSGPVTSLFDLGTESLAPTDDAVARMEAVWLVLDRVEWQARLRSAGIDSTAVADSLRTCCALVYADPHAWVYRRRTTP